MEVVNSFVEKIKKLDEKDIDSFIEKRINELSNLEGKTIGLNSDTCIYNGFLDEKIRVNYACGCFEEHDGPRSVSVLFGSMKFDDPEMFNYLIDDIKSRNSAFPLQLVSIMMATDAYLSLDEEISDEDKDSLEELKDNLDYSSAIEDKTYSIKLFRALNVSTCSQIAGVNHNLCKFLGFESDYVIVGNHNDGLHAFNIIYPWGRENDAILLDSARSAISDPIIYYLDKERKEKLFTNQIISFNKEDLEKAYKKLFNLDIECVYKEDECYSILENRYTEEKGTDLLREPTANKLVFRRVE